MVPDMNALLKIDSSRSVTAMNQEATGFAADLQKFVTIFSALDDKPVDRFRDHLNEIFGTRLVITDGLATDGSIHVTIRLREQVHSGFARHVKLVTFEKSFLPLRMTNQMNPVEGERWEDTIQYWLVSITLMETPGEVAIMIAKRPNREFELGFSTNNAVGDIARSIVGMDHELWGDYRRTIERKMDYLVRDRVTESVIFETT